MYLIKVINIAETELMISLGKIGTYFRITGILALITLVFAVIALIIVLAI